MSTNVLLIELWDAENYPVTDMKLLRPVGFLAAGTTAAEMSELFSNKCAGVKTTSVTFAHMFTQPS